MRHLTIVRAISVLVLLTLFCQMVLGTTPSRRAAVAKDQSTKPVDWSTAVVESTMKRLPTVKDLGVWNYPRGLYLYGQYLVYRRTHDPRYLQYLKEWVDSHVDANGVVTNTAADGKVNEVK